MDDENQEKSGRSGANSKRSHGRLQSTRGMPLAACACFLFWTTSGCAGFGEVTLTDAGTAS